MINFLRLFLQSGGKVVLRFYLEEGTKQTVVTKEIKFSDFKSAILFSSEHIGSLLREGAEEILNIIENKE